MEPVQSGEDAGDGCSGETSRTAGTGRDSPGRSGAGGGEIVAQHLSLKDFRTLLKLLNITLPKKVLNDDVTAKSKNPHISTKANIIVQKLKHDELQIVQTPRLYCRTIKTAYSHQHHNDVQKFTEMIFFKKMNKKGQTLKQRWEKIPLNKRRGLRMKQTYRGTRSAGGEETGNKNKTQNQRNEMKCLRFFIRENGLSDVRYKRERNIEFEFLSGKMDFLIKTNCKEPEKSETIILECKGTAGDMVGKVYNKPGEGHNAELNSEHQYYHQTQAYLYLLKKTQRHAAPVKAAMVFREHQQDEEDEDDDMDDEEDQEETDEEENRNDDEDEKYKVYKENEEELKGDFCYNYVEEDGWQIEELNNYCKENALPLYLAVLNKIFEKVEKKESVKNERERKRQRQTERETERETERKRQRQTERETDTDTDTDADAERERERETDTDTDEYYV